MGEGRGSWYRGGYGVRGADRPRPVVQRVEVKVVADAPARVAIAPKITALVAGQAYPLTATGISRDGDQVLSPATWKSANPSVARVSAEGVVTALGAGRTTLTATVNGVSTTMPVEVVSAAAGRSSLTASASRVRQGTWCASTSR